MHHLKYVRNSPYGSAPLYTRVTSIRGGFPFIGAPFLPTIRCFRTQGAIHVLYTFRKSPFITFCPFASYSRSLVVTELVLPRSSWAGCGIAIASPCSLIQSPPLHGRRWASLQLRHEHDQSNAWLEQPLRCAPARRDSPNDSCRPAQSQNMGKKSWDARSIGKRHGPLFIDWFTIH